MTTTFDSFDASPLGGFTASPVRARNKGRRGPIWLATRILGSSEYVNGYIYELDTETFNIKRWGRAPTPLVEGIGGDEAVIWYCDNKYSPRGPDILTPQLWQLSPTGWATGEDVPIQRIGEYDQYTWFHGVGGAVNIIWAVIDFETFLPPHFRLVELDAANFSTTGRESGVPFPGTTGCGGTPEVVYVCGTSIDPDESNLVSKRGHDRQTFRGARIDLGDAAAGFQDVGGSPEQIWALGDATYYRNLLYEIDPANYAIRKVVEFHGVYDGPNLEVAYAMGGK